jgi:hypothetical protein
MTLRWSGGALRLPTFPTCKLANGLHDTKLNLNTTNDLDFPSHPISGPAMAKIDGEEPALLSFP